MSENNSDSSDKHLRITLTDAKGSREADLYSSEGYDLAAEMWLKATCHNRLMYELPWMGIPIIQYPGDIMMMQELIWKVRPDLIIETGVAHGGSAVFYASMLELIGNGRLMAIDVEIRKYNSVAIESHPMFKRIELVEGSSIDPAVIAKACNAAVGASTVLVTLDSNHSYEHVKKEIEVYSPLVTQDSYLVVMDGAQGLVSDIPNGKAEWKEDNPLPAIEEFISAHGDEWEIDPHYTRLKVTSNPNGYLRRRGSSDSGGNKKNL